jgi:hypothetical protein
VAVVRLMLLSLIELIWNEDCKSDDANRVVLDVPCPAADVSGMEMTEMTIDDRRGDETRGTTVPDQNKE